jgi:hypothetical protein
VKPGDAELIFSASDFARTFAGAGFTFFEELFLEGDLFVAFFTAISYLQLSLEKPMTRGLLG